MLSIRPIINDGVNFIEKFPMWKYLACRRCLVKGFRKTGVAGGSTDRRRMVKVCDNDQYAAELKKKISTNHCEHFSKIVSSNFATGRYFEHLLCLSH
jgi:hypothetical protein